MVYYISSRPYDCLQDLQRIKEMTWLISILVALVLSTIIVGLALMIGFTIFGMYYILIKLVRFIL